MKRRESPRRRWQGPRTLRIRLLLLACLLLSLFLGRAFIRARVVGRSMHPTLEEGDHLLGLRISHSATPPWPALRRALLQRGRVVLVRPPAHLGRLEVKRIDGLPGDLRGWGGSSSSATQDARGAWARESRPTRDGMARAQPRLSWRALRSGIGRSAASASCGPGHAPRRCGARRQSGKV